MPADRYLAAGASGSTAMAKYKAHEINLQFKNGNRVYCMGLQKFYHSSPTHCDLNKMADNLQTAFSSAFSWQ